MKSTLTPSGTLKELPEMRKPERLDYILGMVGDHKYEMARAKYQKAKEDGLELTIVGSHTWIVGQVVEEGKDYRIEQRDWRPETEDDYNEMLYEQKHELGPFNPVKIPVAIPIAEKQEDLWKEVANVFIESPFLPDCIKKAKERFTITRKQQ